MNLEQIEKRQCDINEKLNFLLQGTIYVVERIIGEHSNIETAEENINIAYSGLLSEISNSQNATQLLIQRLHNYNQLLNDAVFDGSKENTMGLVK